MERGGWKPVFRRRKGGLQGNRTVNADLFTLFVDDLPNSMDPKSLYSLFGKFGVVKDVFIPSKRRKSSGTRFGFVRYECKVATDVAIQKANRLWCDNKALRVKQADVQKSEGIGGKDRPIEAKRIMSGVQKVLSQVEMQRHHRRSYAEAVKHSTDFRNDELVVHAKEAGSEWLSHSLLVSLKAALSFHDFEAEVKERMKEVRVRSGGCNLAILTFHSKQLMHEERERMDAWILRWSDSITEWGKGKSTSTDRCVWISCMGVPFHLWNNNTFRDIGSIWGKVVQLQEDINNPCFFEFGRVRIVTSTLEVINTVVFLECNACKFPVRVCEEHPLIDWAINYRREVNSELLASCSLSIACKQKLIQGNGSEAEEDDGSVSSKEVAKVFADVADNEAVANSAEGTVDTVQEQTDGAFEVLAEPVVSGTEHVLGNAQCNDNGNMECLELVTRPRIEVPDQFQKEVGRVWSTEDVRTFCESDRVRPNINLQVVLSGLQAAAVVTRPIGVDSNLSESAAHCNNGPTLSLQPVQARRKIQDITARSGATDKEGKKHGSKLKRRLKHLQSPAMQKGILLSPSLRNGAILRAATAAISASISRSDASRRRAAIREEALATLQVGKVLGMDCKDKEQEVVNRIVLMELKDRERVEDAEGAV